MANKKIEDNFLSLNKKYFALGLKSVDILIIAQVEEFQRNECECYITNEQFSKMFGESESTIKRSIEKLEKMNVIKRNTNFIKNNGKGNRQRTLSVNNLNEWKVHIEPSNKEWKAQKEEMDGSKVINGRFKNQECKDHNEPIKDNLKENKNKTLKEKKVESVKRTIEDLEDYECEDVYKRLKNHESYISVSNLYNLNPGSITKDFLKWWEEKKKHKAYLAEQQAETERRKNEPVIDYDKLYARANNPEKDKKEREHQEMMEEIAKDLLSDFYDDVPTIDDGREPDSLRILRELNAAQEDDIWAI